MPAYRSLIFTGIKFLASTELKVINTHVALLQTQSTQAKVKVIKK